MSAPPEIIFGAASIGASFTTKEDVRSVVKALREAAVSHIDTAGRYPPTAPGMSQKLLGDAKVADDGFKIDTKIAVVGADASGSLTSQSIEKSIAESLDSLGVSKVNVLYCHAPDHVTPLEQQAAAFDKHFKLKQFDYVRDLILPEAEKDNLHSAYIALTCTPQLGISNFPPEMIEEWMQICNDKGYIKPCIYQGQYNLFFRGYEENLFPVLRKHGMHFTAFSPLAGGFLTGKLTPSAKIESLAGTRFEPGNVMGTAFRHWYDKPSMYQGLESLQALCKMYNTPMDEAALRWLFYHSLLKAEDGVILGASRVAQIAANTTAISQGPLPEAFVRELNELWQIVKD